MATSNILGGNRTPKQARGRDVDALGPSDSSDSGSDVQGTFDLDDSEQFDPNAGARQTGMESDSDAAGTGERGAARLDEEAESGSDISPDSVQTLGPLAPETDTVPLEGLDTDLSDLAADEDDGSETDIERAQPRRGH